MNRTFASPLSALLVLVLISSVSLAWPEASPCSGENASQSVSVTYAQSAPLGSAAWAALTSAEWCVGTSVYALGECHYAARDCASGTCSAVSSIVGGAKNVVSALANEVLSPSLRSLQSVFSFFSDLVSDLLRF